MTTVADHIQMSHHDCGKLNNHSWIFHVLNTAHGSYIYIWDMDMMKKTLVHIPLGSFMVLHDDVWYGRMPEVQVMSEYTVKFLAPGLLRQHQNQFTLLIQRIMATKLIRQLLTAPTTKNPSIIVM